MIRLAARALPLFLLLVGFSSALAQDTPTASHLEAANELLALVDAEDQVAMSSSMVLAAMMETDPELSLFEDVIEKWLTEVVDWDAVMAQMAVLYTESFTEAELREISAFYVTPVGKKCISELPDLMERGGELGQEAMTTYAPQLETMIMQRIGEMEAGGEVETEAGKSE
jgi:hypothetical protein